MSSFIISIRFHYRIVVAVLLFAVTVMSLWPLEQLPAFTESDKLHHMVAYAVVMFPLALGRPSNRIGLGVLLGSYSGVIELLQPFVNRYADWGDLAANGLGVIAGGLLAEFACRYLSELREAS